MLFNKWEKMNKKTLSLMLALGTLFIPAHAANKPTKYTIAQSALGTLSFPWSKHPEEDILECPICLDPITKNISTLPQVILEDGTQSCGHSFHTSCFKGLVSTNQECPICRTEIQQESIPAISIQDLLDVEAIPAIEDGVLDLSNRNISSLDGLQNIPNINTVETLVLENNRITKLKNAFVGLNNLKELFLLNNKICNIKNAFIDLNQLQILSLANNRITKVQDVFINLHELKVLALNDNTITNIQNTFTNLSQLQVLTLDNNRLINIKNTFTQLDQLRALSLNNNGIGKIKDALAPLKKLETLFLSLNLITYEQDAFKGLIHIKELTMIGNQPMSDAQIQNIREHLPHLKSVSYDQ
jgi:hypothetical protein